MTNHADELLAEVAALAARPTLADDMRDVLRDDPEYGAAVHDDTAKRLHSAAALTSWPTPIRCSEQMPPDGERVLFWDGLEWRIAVNDDGLTVYDSDCWMPLPPNPRD